MKECAIVRVDGGCVLVDTSSCEFDSQIMVIDYDNLDAGGPRPVFPHEESVQRLVRSLQLIEGKDFDWRPETQPTAPAPETVNVAPSWTNLAQVVRSLCPADAPALRALVEDLFAPCRIVDALNAGGIDAATAEIEKIKKERG